MDPTSSAIHEATHSVPETPLKTEMDTKPKPITGVFKVQKVGPTFKIVDPHEIRKEAKSVATSSKKNITERKTPDSDLYVDEEGPEFHNFRNAMITRSILTKKLPNMFKDFPIHGAPERVDKLKEYQRKKLQDFMGGGLVDQEFDALEKFCNPNNLRTGEELNMVSKVPTQGLLTKALYKDTGSDDEEIDAPKRRVSNSFESMDEVPDLNILKKLRARQGRDVGNSFQRMLKHRGVKALTLQQQPSEGVDAGIPPDLEPGKDTLFRVRLYRPFHFAHVGDRMIRGRHSVFECDIILCGRQSLTEFRDKITCRNDLDMRVDVSDNPDRDACGNITAKSAFPSGFLFINNVFYVDRRSGCRDISEPIRRWASTRGLGQFPCRDMAGHTLDNILVKIAHPDVYVHQGNCEHIFIFSEIRLLNRSDPLHLSSYPCHTAVSQNQTIYCTTCAEYGAKWLVTGSDRVPFDPAFFCETCFKQYLYKDGRKIGDFKAFHYKGNEVNMLKSVHPLNDAFNG